MLVMSYIKLVLLRSSLMSRIFSRLPSSLDMSTFLDREIIISTVETALEEHSHLIGSPKLIPRNPLEKLSLGHMHAF